MAISDTLTRAALRQEVLRDLVERAEGAAVPIEGGPLDGIAVVSLGILREQVAAALAIDLPAPSTRFAEVTTPALVLVSALCPECGLPCEISVNLTPQLTVDNDGAELAVKAKTKARVHVCGQLALPETAEQADFGLGDIVGELPSDEAIIDALILVRTLLPAGIDRLDDEYPLAGWSDLDKRLAYEWAVARLAADGEHPEGCSAHFATDGTTGERVCDCGLAAAVPPLPAILGGEDPEDEDGEDGEENPEGAEPDPDVPTGDYGAATEPEDDCPFPGCALSAEHAGDHAIVEDDGREAEARIDTIYSRAAERVAEKRAARVEAQGPGFTPAQAAQAAAELERDLDGPVH